VFLEIQPTVLPWGSLVSPFSWFLLWRCEAVGFARAASAVGDSVSTMVLSEARGL